jgi:hypothetical protein
VLAFDRMVISSDSPLTDVPQPPQPIGAMATGPKSSGGVSAFEVEHGGSVAIDGEPGLGAAMKIQRHSASACPYIRCPDPA